MPRNCTRNVFFTTVTTRGARRGDGAWAANERFSGALAHRLTLKEREDAWA
jgi:hypothetical protein